MSLIQRQVVLRLIVGPEQEIDILQAKFDPGS